MFIKHLQMLNRASPLCQGVALGERGSRALCRAVGQPCPSLFQIEALLASEHP